MGNFEIIEEWNYAKMNSCVRHWDEQKRFCRSTAIFFLLLTELLTPLLLFLLQLPFLLLHGQELGFELLRLLLLLGHLNEIVHDDCDGQSLVGMVIIF